MGNALLLVVWGERLLLSTTPRPEPGTCRGRLTITRWTAGFSQMPGISSGIIRLLLRFEQGDREIGRSLGVPA